MHLMVKEQVSICISNEIVAQHREGFKSYKFLRVQYKDTQSAFTAWKHHISSSAFSSDAFQLVPHEQYNTTTPDNSSHIICHRSSRKEVSLHDKALSFLHSMTLQNVLHTTTAFLDLRCGCITVWTTSLTALSQVFPNMDLHIWWFFRLLRLHCQLKSNFSSSIRNESVILPHSLCPTLSHSYLKFCQHKLLTNHPIKQCKYYSVSNTE